MYCSLFFTPSQAKSVDIGVVSHTIPNQPPASWTTSVSLHAHHRRLWATGFWGNVQGKGRTYPRGYCYYSTQKSKCHTAALLACIKETCIVLLQQLEHWINREGKEGSWLWSAEQQTKEAREVSLSSALVKRRWHSFSTSSQGLTKQNCKQTSNITAKSTFGTMLASSENIQAEKRTPFTFSEQMAFN